MMYFSKTQPGPTDALLAQKAKDDHNKHYDITGVRTQLADDFHGLCYICGFATTSMRIEHFRPHRGNRDLMFDWQNLFYACEHCNALKSDSFTELLDCCQVNNIDSLMSFDYHPAKKARQKVAINDINSNSPDTVELIALVFSANNTPTKRAGAAALERKLGQALRDFEWVVEQYVQDQNTSNETLLRHEINNPSEFAAFKRWAVRRNPQNYPAQLMDWFVD